jgi:nucleoside-diphosphate-sugar epimerase
MRILFIGGTGLISSACTRLALARGHEVFHLNRGNRVAEPGATALTADVHDEAAAAAALGDREFDAVVDWIAFLPADVERDLRLLRGRTGHYVLVSSATVLQNPDRRVPIRDDSRLWAPDWEYARNKIACEERAIRALREEAFPVTIVRPSHTYGERSIPLAMRSLTRQFTSIERMRAGKPVIVPGDGTSLWTLTHTSDFAVGLVGLLGRAEVVGESFNIVSDEPLSWDQIYRETAAAAGVEPNLVHMTSEFIVDCMPDLHGRLLGDGSLSSVFDNSKIKRFVPDYRPAVAFADGIRRSIAWFEADPSRREFDAEIDAAWDRMIEAWESGLVLARGRYRG